MRMFVTGATGFIGSHVAKHALAAGHEVVALRRSTAARPRIELTQEPTWLTKQLAQIVEGDLAGVDAVVHLAAAGVSPQVAIWDELLESNVVAPAKLLATVASADVSRWVVAGTCAEYGRAGERYDFIPPDAPLEPVTAYAASKAAASVLFRALAVERRARLSYLRLFSVFGAGQHEANLWPTIRHAALAGDDLPLTRGEQVRDFMGVDEVAAALVAAAVDDTVEPGRPSVRNVGSGQPQTVRQFAEHWWREFGARGRLLIGALPYRADEVMRYVPQI